MKKQTRRKFSPAFKAKVALEAVKNQQTLAELAKKFDLNSVVISKWKAEILENLSATLNVLSLLMFRIMIPKNSTRPSGS
jgi:transposase-like protein